MYNNSPMRPSIDLREFKWGTGVLYEVTGRTSDFPKAGFEHSVFTLRDLSLLLEVPNIDVYVDYIAERIW